MIDILTISFMMNFSLWSTPLEEKPTMTTEPIIQEVLPVRVTAYNAVPEQTNENPEVTASGLRSNPEVVAARSRDLDETLPFGTIIRLSGAHTEESCGFTVVEEQVGYRVIADVMHPRKRNQIDVMFDMANTVPVGDKHINPAVAMGICHADAEVIGHIPLAEVPATQAALVDIVENRHYTIASL